MFVGFERYNPGFADDFSLSFPFVDGARRIFSPEPVGGCRRWKPTTSDAILEKNMATGSNDIKMIQTESQHLNRKPLWFPWKTIVLPVKFPLDHPIEKEVLLFGNLTQLCISEFWPISHRKSRGCIPDPGTLEDPA